MGSALWVVRPALFTLFSAAQPASVAVYDGPRPRGDTPKKFLLVGVNSGLDEGSEAMRAIQSPSAMDGGWRDEVGEIDCCAVTWTGDDDMTAIRDAARDIVATCETAVNADPTLGGVLTLNNNQAELVRLDIREARTDKGPFVEATFTVAYATVLTS